MDPRIESFLKSNDHCSIASIDKHGGFPHCVPISYLYKNGLIYIPTSSRSKKVSNFALNQKCCILVDVYENEKGRGVMLQGSVIATTVHDFENLKQLVESTTGWNLDKWKVGKFGEQRVDIIIVFRLQRWVVIGNLLHSS
jgi:nitroimidazol reductase NimA-like FMN-containing flavoprotein (pyridoxamine 5'-phosphate oxidase superfamily)